MIQTVCWFVKLFVVCIAGHRVINKAVNTRLMGKDEFVLLAVYSWEWNSWAWRKKLSRRQNVRWLIERWKGWLFLEDAFQLYSHRPAETEVSGLGLSGSAIDWRRLRLFQDIAHFRTYTNWAAVVRSYRHHSRSRRTEWVLVLCLCLPKAMLAKTNLTIYG